jgi:hypothetical protein
MDEEFMDECPFIRQPSDYRDILEEMLAFGRWIDVLSRRGQFYASLARFEASHAD